MKIHTSFAQNSLEWLVARAGVVTASEFDNIITPTWVPRDGQMVTTYLCRKIAEWWLGGPLPGFNTIDMEYGKIREEISIPWYEFEYGVTVERVGFVTTDDGLVGCSPDALLPNEQGLEVKCPSAAVHVKYLMYGELPPEYAAQVHGSMHVTGFESWKFLSFCPGFPPLLLVIERDEQIQRAISETLEAFLARFQKAKDRIIELNGGPPKRMTQRGA